MKLQELAAYFLGPLIDKDLKAFRYVKDKPPKADIKIPFRTYVGLIYFSSIFCLGNFVSDSQFIHLPQVVSMKMSLH